MPPRVVPPAVVPGQGGGSQRADPKNDSPSKEKLAEIVAAVLSQMDLKGPAGPSGPRGEKGESGMRGSPGPPGKDVDPETLKAILKRLDDLERADYVIEIRDAEGNETTTRDGRPNVVRFGKDRPGKINLIPVK